MSPASRPRCPHCGQVMPLRSALTPRDPITEEEVALADRLRRRGLSIRAIARTMGRSVGGVWVALQRGGMREISR